MKTAVIFYSNNGNCALVAEQIKTRMNADLLHVHAKNEKKRCRVGRFCAAFAMIFIHRRPAIEPLDFDLSDYDLIIVGTPVWAASPAPPMQTFLSQAGITGKKMALFVSHAGGQGRALERFRNLLPGNTIIAEMDFTNPVRNYEDTKRHVANWVKTICNQLDVSK